MSAATRGTAAAEDIAADHSLIIEAVREAGALASRYFGGPLKVREKGPGDPVSDADLAVDSLLHRKLREARPGYGWLSEESEDDPARLGPAPVFIVDPIDGTKTFIKGVPDFAVCVALVRDGRPLAAAVFNPATDEFFDARLDGGARLNGDPIAVTEQALVDGARLLASARELRTGRWPEAFAGARVSDRGSIAYKLALVVKGERIGVDASTMEANAALRNIVRRDTGEGYRGMLERLAQESGIETPTAEDLAPRPRCGRHDGAVSMTAKSDWDIAAADLIVAEAGGRVTTAAGGRFRYNRASVRHPSVIAAGASLHRELLRRLESGNAFKEEPGR